MQGSGWCRFRAAAGTFGLACPSNHQNCPKLPRRLDSSNMGMRKNPLVVVLAVSFAFFVLFVVMAAYFLGGLGPGGLESSTQKKLFGKSNAVGVIEVKGAILDSKKAVEQIEGFVDNAMIKAVIVRINSPGGAVAPSQEIYGAVKKLAAKKPVFASLGSVAASGGYYVACGAKKIYANPGSITASIGVIMQFADMSKLFQWAKMNPYNIKTGKFKDIGSPNREMTDEEKALLQAMANNVLSQFRSAVAESRGLAMDKVIEISDGRIMSGEQAKSVKLVDELGGFRDAVDAVAKEAGISGKPRLIYASKKKTLFVRLFETDDDGDSDSSESRGGVAGLLANLLTRVAARAASGAAADLSHALSERVDSPGLQFMMPQLGR